MELNLPPSFVHVTTVKFSPKDTMVNVIGVVIDYQPPAKTRGSDYMMTFRLTDHCYHNEFGCGEGMNVRIFQKEINLPLIECPGDVVLLRQFKRMDVNGVPYLTSSWSSHIMCFPAATIPDPAFKHAFGDQNAPPHTKHPVGAMSSGTENYYILALRDWASGIKDLPRKSFQAPEDTSLLPPKGPSKLLSLPKKPPPPATAHNSRSVAALSAPEGLPSIAGLPPQRAQPSTSNVISKYQDKKFSLLKDIKDGTYVTLVGEVRKLWGNLHGTQMYLTDYTSNNLLFDYKSNDGQAEGQDGDTHGYLANTQRRGWGGPFGKMTVQITLWPPHDSFVNTEVVEGEIVLVRNVHISFRNKYLEGKLHTDRRFPQQVDVRKLPQADPLVLAFKARKADYEDHKLAAENKKPSHKAEKKKRRKQERERLARQQGSGGNKMPDSTVETGQEKHVAAKGELNPNVIAGNEHQPCLTISEFINTPHLQTQDASGNEMTLPFVNQRVRSQVRVVDFMPDNIQDFAHVLDDKTYHNTKTRSVARKWEWAFYILVQDSKPAAGEEPTQLPLQVFGIEAIQLLGLNPVDLRKDERTLNKLKEKLFTLWGDLEELKSAGKLESGTSNKPFECCIKEFGVQSGDDWARMHAICDTRIR